MKKFALLIALLALVAVCAGCGVDTPAETAGTTETTIPLCAEHQWLEAACYSPKTCSVCGLTEGGPVHQYEWFATQDATCEETGLTEYFCKICDDPKTEEIPALGHSYENGVCKNCGQEEKK